MSEALAVKYRPKYFSEVIGQERSIQILQNQIKNGTVRQGYLFCGSAGTGKTTVARIMASALKADLIEIDAASNNGVDNIRELRENVKFKPLGHERRVYIIDECHQLSTGAFNALLKVLEEPPSHIVFILCTTDPQKIPATIISRLQRFDFKRVSSEKICERLHTIINMEGEELDPEWAHAVDIFDVEEAALEYIAKISGGGVRDAISLLDTCLGYSPTISLQNVLDIIGAVSIEKNIDIWSALTTDAPEKIIEVVNDLYENGKDLKVFVRRFLDFVGDLEIFSLTNNWALVEIPKTYEKRISELSLSFEDFKRIVPRLFELHRLIQYDPKPKNIIISCMLDIIGRRK